jgi:hypothetical protein
MPPFNDLDRQRQDTGERRATNWLKSKSWTIDHENLHLISLTHFHLSPLLFPFSPPKNLRLTQWNAIRSDNTSSTQNDLIQEQAASRDTQPPWQCQWLWTVHDKQSVNQLNSDQPRHQFSIVRSLLQYPRIIHPATYSTRYPRNNYRLLVLSYRQYADTIQDRNRIQPQIK